MKKKKKMSKCRWEDCIPLSPGNAHSAITWLVVRTMKTNYAYIDNSWGGGNRNNRLADRWRIEPKRQFLLYPPLPLVPFLVFE